MFADSLVESSRRRPSPRRSLSLLTSVAIEALAIAVLVVIPIWHPDVMAAVTPHVIYAYPYAPANPDVPPDTRPSHGNPGGGPHGPSSPGPIIRNFDPSHHVIYDTSLPPQGPGEGGLPGMPGVGPTTGTYLIPANSTPVPPLAKKPPLIVSHYDPGSLVRQVTPDYPATARMARVQGDVVLQAVVTRAGTIERLTGVSGNPLLVPAARDAVRQWRFRPYILNGQAVEIETTITVKFQLDGGGGTL